QVTGPLREPFQRLREEVRQRLGLGLGELQERRGPIAFHDVVAEALIFPVAGKGDEKEAAERVLEHTRRYYEETWIHRPRPPPGGMAGGDAVGHAKLRKRVRGVIQFIQDCARGGMLGTLDFDRLRRKLGLLEAAPAPAGAAPADVTALSAAEL